MATVSSAPPVDVKAAARIAAQYFDQLLQHPYSDLAQVRHGSGELLNVWALPRRKYCVCNGGMRERRVV
jgi:hypothetical protein